MPEQTRARYPDEEGYVVRDGARLFYEVYGDGEPTLFLLPPWSIVHSRHWKAQIAYLARHARVVIFDGLGNGKSDRNRDPRRYSPEAFAADALAVMDATGTERAVLVALSRGAQWALRLAVDSPERVDGAVFIGSMFPITLSSSRLVVNPLLRRRFQKRGIYWWLGRMNGRYWRENYAEFVLWFISRCLPEPHSTKQIEDGVDWALDTDPETLVATALGTVYRDRGQLRELASNVRCPVLVIHGTKDKITPYRDGKVLARITGGKLETITGGGHLPHARKPVQVNLALRDFVVPHRPKRDPTAYAGSDGRQRALYISSPIGLGHARRDVAIAQELRTLVPDLQIDWLAQPPVTSVLAESGERIHPASAHLANESQHIESESAGHDLHCFQAVRRMDEILIANFMLFHDVVNEERYDLWIADEGWEIDYYLHENPNEKRANYVWLTDFVGWLPMPDGGAREAYVTADYNAEMIGHVEGLPHVRDRAIFVGTPEDIVPGTFGPNLPPIRDWTVGNYDFSGYITGFGPDELADRELLRAELGYAPDEKVCIVTVGGSGVGGHLLRKVIAAHGEASRLVPGLRMVVVAGPRIDPASLPRSEGLEVHAYVHDLYRHLAACDLAVVQGGLTTAMELTANRRPFLYFPLRHHFEQNFHVHHRLQRYRAGRRMEFDESTPEAIAHAIAAEIGREVDYRPVEQDGARMAAQRIAELL